MDPSTVGFERGAGILAFAVTSHPDFDDTPLYDENGDGKLDNDGDLWHSHWVVLTRDAACGKDALKIEYGYFGRSVTITRSVRNGVEVQLLEQGRDKLVWKLGAC